MPNAQPLIFDAIRTPRGRGKHNGSLYTVKPIDLVVGLIDELLERNPKLDPEKVDDVVLGCVSPVGDQGMDIAKTAALKAGLPDTVPGVQLNRFCASGLEAVNVAAQKVASGWEDLVLAGGVDAVALQRYHWVERIDHVHTAGNSSGIVDGAALMAVGNEQTGSELGLKPRARVLATALSGADPTIMLTGPAPASRKALEKAGLTVDDLDLVEMNEAFAAVVLRFVSDMGLSMEKVNVNGGAIAMGHPLGATGAMILGALIDELHRTGGRYGLTTLCVGGGMGIATVVSAISWTPFA